MTHGVWPYLYVVGSLYAAWSLANRGSIFCIVFLYVAISWGIKI